MESLDKFLTFQTDKLTAGRSIPIDLVTLSAELGIEVEEREMIPEAVMQPLDGRLRIFIQSNFKNLPGRTSRARFSWAHELGHTLFYEQVEGELKVRAGAPRGDALEAACHQAASMILIPSRALRQELQDQPLEGATQVSNLASRFEVSIEVMLRRLNEFVGYENGWAPVLTRRSAQNIIIEFGAYPVWLKPYGPSPQRGVEFSAWFRPTEQSDRVFRKRLGDVIVEATPVDVTKSLTIFELRLHS